MSRQTDLKATQVVALVLENHQGDVLIQQRQKGKHLAGFWEFPGGKVEANESLIEALEREIQEELNYTPQSPNYLTTLTHHYTDKSIELIVYHQVATQAQVHNAENQPLKWVAKSQLLHTDMPAANLAIIKILNCT